MSAVMRSGERRPRGELEQHVLDRMAATPRAMTAAEVQQSLGNDLAYTTVMTTLVRLFEKGALLREPSGRAFRYRLACEPASIAANVTAHQMHRLLATGNRAQVLCRFIAELSPGEEQTLLGLLQTAVAVDTAPASDFGRSPHE